VSRNYRRFGTISVGTYLRSAKPDTRPLGQLQNPESQASYVGYMVKFACFYLQIIADGEVRTLQHRQKHRSICS
jgi:hypothetical protein